MSSTTTMTFSVGVYSITLRTPAWGYTVEYKLNTRIQWLASGQPRIWDNGSTYDHRIFRGKIDLDETDANLFFEWYREYRLGRAQDVSLALGATSTGFYPFGPDYGDVGTFSVRILKITPSGMQMEPFRYSSVDLEMVCVTHPAFSLPAVRSEGTFSIGGVSGLRYPQGGFNPEMRLAVGSDLTQSGAPTVADLSAHSDSWVTSWTQQANQPNAAAIMAELVGAGRGEDQTIVAPAHYWMFGQYRANVNGSGTYTANLVSGDEGGMSVEITHVEHEQWEIPLKYWMQARTA